MMDQGEGKNAIAEVIFFFFGSRRMDGWTRTSAA
jgi:hypothetical protein